MANLFRGGSVASSFSSKETGHFGHSGSEYTGAGYLQSNASAAASLTQDDALGDARAASASESPPPTLSQARYAGASERLAHIDEADLQSESSSRERDVPTPSQRSQIGQQTIGVGLGERLPETGSSSSPRHAAHEEENRRLRQEFSDRRRVLKDQADLHAMEMAADASLLHIPAEGVLAVQERKAEAWKTLQKAMGVDERSSRRDSCDAWLMGIVNLSYLMVIVGCEIDLYGFMMAWTAYWEMDRLEVRILLILCPLGYVLATLMYMGYNWKILQQMDEEEAKKGDGPAMSDEDKKTLRLTAREPIRVEYYHFMPIFRYYLVIKDKEANDIEGLFRVNSLSSFSLGICQICGILIQCFVIEQEVNVFVKINIASQILNWFITLMYFTTPVAARMKSAIKVDALIYNSNQELRRMYEQYMQMTADYSQQPSDANLKALQHIESSIDREICLFSKAKLDLREFDLKTKMDALRMIRRKQYNLYARI